jgi:hypothetical protein
MCRLVRGTRVLMLGKEILVYEVTRVPYNSQSMPFSKSVIPYLDLIAKVPDKSRIRSRAPPETPGVVAHLKPPCDIFAVSTATHTLCNDWPVSTM